MGTPLKNQLGDVGQPISRAVQQAIKNMIYQAERTGIKSFSIGFRDPISGSMVIHMQNMPANDAVNIAGQQWLTAMREEIALHPEYGNAKRKILENGVKSFQDLLLEFNKKIAQYVKKHPEE